MRTISMLVLMVLLSTGLAHAMEPMEGVPLRLVRDADALERAQKRKWRGKVLMAIGIVHWGRLVRRRNLDGPRLLLPAALLP